MKEEGEERFSEAGENRCQAFTLLPILCVFLHPSSGRGHIIAITTPLLTLETLPASLARLINEITYMA